MILRAIFKRRRCWKNGVGVEVCVLGLVRITSKEEARDTKSAI
jgi:hypothetical protein